MAPTTSAAECQLSWFCARAPKVVDSSGRRTGPLVHLTLENQFFFKERFMRDLVESFVKRPVRSYQSNQISLVSKSFTIELRSFAATNSLKFKFSLLLTNTFCLNHHTHTQTLRLKRHTWIQESHNVNLDVKCIHLVENKVEIKIEFIVVKINAVLTVASKE